MMKCPYRTIKRKTAEPTITDPNEHVISHQFAECYGTDCPFYQPEVKRGALSVPEGCKRAEIEELNAKKERK